MAGSTLFVDVWDADALMHVGTLALPLRMLMRQQKGVVKTAMVRETKWVYILGDISVIDKKDACFGRGITIFPCGAIIPD